MESSSELQYCFHCMEKIGEQVAACPHCGKGMKSQKYSERVLPPGSILAGKYLLGEVLGEGGFGITYIGIDLNLQLKVAIKEYFPALLASRSINQATDYRLHVIGGKKAESFQKGLKDYAKEANRLVSFSSLPGIVSVNNFFYENGTAYLVMDYIEGITLKEYLKKNNEMLGWKETLELMHPVIISLQQIHREGIIHRDISPDNIMMSRNGEMILIDFGAARRVDHEQQKNTVILKKAYAPLEQYQTDGNQGTWSDVYSMCSVIYRMISGQKVPDALSVASGDATIIPLKVLISNVPAFLSNTLSRGLETEVSMRIRDMEQLEGYLYKSVKIKRRIEVRAIGYTALACIVVLLAGFFFMNPRVSEGEIEQDYTWEELESTKEEVEQQNNVIEEGIVDEVTDTVVSYEAMEDTPVSYFEYEDTERGIAITNVDYAVAEVVVPGSIDGKPVVELRGMSPNATSVVIKNGVEKIADGTFSNCVYLESIYLPDSITTIENGAFENCVVLENIIVSDNNPGYYSRNGDLYTKEGRLVYE